MARFRRKSQICSSRLKILNYLEGIMVRNEAIPKGSFETIFLSESGYVCEGTVSNVFMVRGNKVMTPSLDCGVLPGITRKIVLELASYVGLGTHEGKFSENQLKGSDEVFVTNSLIEIIPVVKIDDELIGDGKVGSATSQIHNLYKELVLRETEG
jgi:branched-subunit amino acid aminotransferase/4-amino-4-deoxychorismate lyase